MTPSSLTLGLDATLRWRAPGWLTAAPALRVLDANGDETAPALAPIVPVDLAIVDGEGDPLRAALQATTLEGDRRTLRLSAEHGLDHIAASRFGDIWLRGHDGSVHAARVGSLVNDTTIRLTDPLRSLPTISADRPASLQWAWHTAPLAGDVELANAGTLDWRVVWAGVADSGTASGVIRVLRQFDSGLTLHVLYEAPGGDVLAAQATRRQDHEAAIEQARRTLERWIRRDMKPRDETAVGDPTQFLDAHILLTNALLQNRAEVLGVRERLMSEARQAYGDVMQALLVDLDADGRADSAPHPSGINTWRASMPSTRLFSIRR